MTALTKKNFNAINQSNGWSALLCSAQYLPAVFNAFAHRSALGIPLRPHLQTDAHTYAHTDTQTDERTHTGRRTHIHTGRQMRMHTYTAMQVGTSTHALRHIRDAHTAMQMGMRGYAELLRKECNIVDK